MFTHVHGSKHTIEFNRNRIQWDRVIRKPRHNTFNSVSRETSQIQRLPTSNIWESSNNVETNTIQFTKLFIVSHEPHGDWFAFRSCQRVITEKGVEKFIFAGRKLFHQGRRLQHIHDIIETSNVPALISGRHWTIARRWGKLISIHGHTRHSCRT